MSCLFAEVIVDYIMFFKTVASFVSERYRLRKRVALKDYKEMEKRKEPFSHLTGERS